MVKHGHEASELLLRERQVLELLKVSRATLRRWIRNSIFPPPQTLQGRIKVWRASHVRDWVSKRID